MLSRKKELKNLTEDLIIEMITEEMIEEVEIEEEEIEEVDLEETIEEEEVTTGEIEKISDLIEMMNLGMTGEQAKDTL
jgi:hypothetical protein